MVASSQDPRATKLFETSAVHKNICSYIVYNKEEKMNSICVVRPVFLSMCSLPFHLDKSMVCALMIV